MVKMTLNGVIKPSNLAYLFRVIAVKGEIGITRRLNHITVEEAYPLPT